MTKPLIPFALKKDSPPASVPNQNLKQAKYTQKNQTDQQSLPPAVIDMVEVSQRDLAKTTGIDQLGELVGLDLPTIEPGSLNNIIPITSNEDLVKYVQFGAMVTKIRMEAGMKIGPITVPDDCWAVVKIAIKNGKLDTKKCYIKFENSNGDRINLDGPWIFDLNKIDIVGRKIAARVQCIPIPIDITEVILGPGVKKVPECPVEFLKLLSQNTYFRNPAMGREETKLCDAIARSLVREQTTFKIEGHVKPGAMKLGPNTEILVKPGTRLEGGGTISDSMIDMDSTLFAQIDSATFGDSPTTITLGSGKCEVGLNFNINKYDMLDNPTPESAAVKVKEFEVNDLTLKLPTLQDTEQIISLGKTSLTNEDGIINWQPGKNRASSDLQVKLHGVELENVNLDLQIPNNDSQHPICYMKFGELADVENPKPLDVLLDIDIDTYNQTTTISAQIPPTQATISDLVLPLDKSGPLKIKEGVLRGGGSILFQANPYEQMLQMDGFQEKWKISAVTNELDLLNFTVKENSKAEVELVHLGLHSNKHPTFAGNATIDARLGKYDIPINDNRSVKIKANAQAEIQIPQMGWTSEEAASPFASIQLRAELEPIEENQQQIGTDVKKDDLNISIKPAPGSQNPVIEVFASLRKDSSIWTHSEFEQNLALHIQAHSANTKALPVPDMPDEPLGPLQNIQMPVVRKPIPREITPTLPASPVPDLPPIIINLNQFLKEMPTSAFDFKIPMDAYRLELPICENDGGWFKWDVKLNAAIEFSDGAIFSNFDVKNDRVQEHSKIYLEKPVNFPLKLTYQKPFSDIDETLEYEIKIKELEIREDRNGRGYFRPIVILPDYLPDELSWLDFDFFDKIAQHLLGDLLGVFLMGDTKFSLNVHDMRKKIYEKIPELDQSIIIDTELPVAIRERNTKAFIPQIGDISWSLEITQQDLLDFLACLHYEQTKFRVSTVVKDGKSLDLSNGQYIDFSMNTELTVQGTPKDFKIDSVIDLDGIKLGNDEMGVELQKPNAHLQLHVTNSDDLTRPAMEIKLLDAKIDHLKTNIYANGVRTNVQSKDLRVPLLTYKMSTGEKPSLYAELPPETKVDFETSGFMQAEDKSVSVDKITGSLTGSFQINDSSFEAKLSETNIHGQGIQSSTYPQGQVDYLNVNGPLHLSLNNKGEFIAKQLDASKPFKVGAFLSGMDGSYVNVNAKSSDNFDQIARFKPGNPPDLFVCGELEVDGLIVIDKAQEQYLDIRKLKTQGSLKLGSGKEAIVFDFAFPDSDISLTNYRVNLSEQNLIHVAHFHENGGGTLKTTADGGLELQSIPDNPITATLKTHDIKFTTDLPGHFKLFTDAAEGSYITDAKINCLRLNGDKSVHLDMPEAKIEAALDPDSHIMSASQSGSHSSEIPLPAARFSAQFKNLNTQIDSTGQSIGNPTCEAFFRVETEIDEDLANENGTWQPVPGMIFEEADIKGTLQLIGHAILKGNGTVALSANIDSYLDIDITGETNTSFSTSDNK